MHEKSPAVLEEKFEDEEEMEPELVGLWTFLFRLSRIYDVLFFSVDYVLLYLFCFVELTEEMEEIIDNALRSHPGGEVLSDGFRLQITRKDMETLAGLNWLNDEVGDVFSLLCFQNNLILNLSSRLMYTFFCILQQIINFYMELLKERGTLDNYPKVHAFNTFFYPKITSGGHSAVRRWTRKVDVFAVDYILIPVHLGMHWCLAVSCKKILKVQNTSRVASHCL